MKRIVLVVLCSLLLSGGAAFAQCFGGSCGFSSVRVSSFNRGFNSFGSGFRGRLQQRRFDRDVSRAIRSQNSLNRLAFAQSFVAPQIIRQQIVVPQVQSFVVPQVSYVQSFAPSYVQSAPQADIPQVTEQLRQLQEMSQALQQLKAN